MFSKKRGYIIDLLLSSFFSFPSITKECLLCKCYWYAHAIRTINIRQEEKQIQKKKRNNQQTTHCIEMGYTGFAV